MKSTLLSQWPSENFVAPADIERLRAFYRGKELLDEQLLKGKLLSAHKRLDVGIVREAKNEEGLMVNVEAGVLVHAVRKRQSVLIA